MNNINTIINDIKDLRGKEVTIFGTKGIMGEPNLYEIDVIDVLESLRSFEVDGLITIYNAELDYCEDEYTEDAEEYLGYLESVYGIKELHGTNTYNWMANISNHINYNIYDCGNGKTYVELRVHRYGDIRCNYTETCLLEFDDEYEFNECLYECNKYVSVTIDNKEYGLDISFFSEGIEVYDIENDMEVGTLYNYYDTEEEVIKDIKEELLANA